MKNGHTCLSFSIIFKYLYLAAKHKNWGLCTMCKRAVHFDMRNHIRCDHKS